MTSGSTASSADSYLILSSVGKAEIKVKGSRFIAASFIIQSVEEAEATLQEVKKKGYNATHHCSAYRLGQTGHIFKYNDDGEPSGTAGLPIFRQIDAREVTNILVIVTRYYGGTKLGTGGLIRAYGEAAGLALDDSTIKEVIVRVPLVVTFAYADTSPALHTINRFDTVIESTAYGDETQMRIGVRQSEASSFQAAFVEALSGRGAISKDNSTD